MSFFVSTSSQTTLAIRIHLLLSKLKCWFCDWFHDHKLKHWIYEYHLVITVILMVTVFVLSACNASLRTWSFLYPATGAVLGLSYFVLKQHLEETRLFKELFSAFNARYDDINDRLNALCGVPDDQSLTRDETMLLYKYFNLCAEEYLYFRKGYIYPEVWTAWHNGMKIFCLSPRICHLWEKELSSGSYYGLTLPCR